MVTLVVLTLMIGFPFLLVLPTLPFRSKRPMTRDRFSFLPHMLLAFMIDFKGKYVS